MGQRLTRREFLLSGVGAAGVLAAGRLLPAETAEKVYYPSVHLPTALPASPVAIERCRSYDPVVLREKLDAACNLVGGLKKLVGNKTVSIKINVTGGPGTLANLPGYRTYQSNPNLLAALCAALQRRRRGGWSCWKASTRSNRRKKSWPAAAGTSARSNRPAATA